MRNIVLFCAAGMSTSLLVNKMKAAAKESGYEVEVNAYAIGAADTYGPEADIILLGPQVSFELAKTKEKFPDKPVYGINMLDYGMMNGKAVLDFVKKTLGD